MPLFSGLLKHKPKNPGELVSKLRSSLQALDAPTRDKSPEKTGYDSYCAGLCLIARMSRVMCMRPRVFSKLMILVAVSASGLQERSN